MSCQGPGAPVGGVPSVPASGLLSGFKPVVPGSEEVGGARAGIRTHAGEAPGASEVRAAWGASGLVPGPSVRREEARPPRNPWSSRLPPRLSPLLTGGLPTPSHPVPAGSCRGQHGTARRAPALPWGRWTLRGHGNPERGWGHLQGDGQAVCPLSLPLALAVSGQTQWMPVGFRPQFSGVSALGTAGRGREGGG